MIDLTMPGHPVLVPQTWTQCLVLNAGARINQAFRRRSGRMTPYEIYGASQGVCLSASASNFAVSLRTKFEAAITPRGATP